jgi:hypothetical protein
MQLEGPIYLVQTTRKAFQFFIEFTENRDNTQIVYLRSIKKLKQELEAIDLNSHT